MKLIKSMMVAAIAMGLAAPALAQRAGRYSRRHINHRPHLHALSKTLTNLNIF